MHTVGWLVVSTLLAAQPAPGGMAAGREYAQLSHCVVSLINHVQLPAQEAGILKELNVKEGQLVTRGQVLGKIDDTDALARKKAAELKRDIANEKATNRSELDVALKIIELAKAEYDESVAINKREPTSVPATTVRRQRVQWEKAILDAAVAEMNFKIAGMEHKVAEAELEAVENELARRTLRAPFDGVVVQLYRQQSEWVQPGDPVVRVIRMDRLRVEGFLNADTYAPEEVLGAPVVIKVKLVEGEEVTFHGKIDYVSPLVEASGDYRVWAEVDNRPGRGGYPWLLRPGSEAEMLIELRRAGRPGAAAANQPRT